MYCGTPTCCNESYVNFLPRSKFTNARWTDLHIRVSVNRQPQSSLSASILVGACKSDHFLSIFRRLNTQTTRAQTQSESAPNSRPCKCNRAKNCANLLQLTCIGKPLLHLKFELYKSCRRLLCHMHTLVTQLLSKIHGQQQ